MSVTREEMITNLEKLAALFYTESEQSKMVDYSKIIETLEFAAAALRPVSREQVEKVFRGCPECKPRCGLCIHMGAWDKYGKPYVCEQCIDCSNFESDQRFCEVCGAPMTDEAVDIIMRRLETLYETT